MRLLPRSCLFAIASVALLSGDDPSWKEKPIPQWDDQDAKQVLADSPWVKSVKLERVRYLSEFERRDGGNWEAGIAPGIGLSGAGLLGLLAVFDSNDEALAKMLIRRFQPD